MSEHANTETVLSALDAEIGSRIRLRRKECGLTQTQLGEVLGVSFQQLQKYERGINRVSSSSLVLIAKALGVKPSALLDDMTAEPSAVASDAMDAARQLLTQPGGPILARAFRKLTAGDARLVVNMADRLAEAA